MLPHGLWISGITGLTREPDRRPVPVDLLVRQGRDKAQEGLMLGVQRPMAEEGADIGFGYLTTRP